MPITMYILDGIVLFYMAGGAGTWGYIFLRTGWPNIRPLEASYKNGWSIAFGISFSIIVADDTSSILGEPTQHIFNKGLSEQFPFGGVYIK